MNHPSSSPAAKRQPVTSRGLRTRERVLRAAESVFAERGFEQSSIAEIASRAEVALGTFYVYFPDKKSVFIELVDELGKRLRHTLTEATAGLGDRLEIERVGLRTFLQFIADHRGMYRIVRQAEFVDEPTFRRYYQQFARGYVAGLAGAMEGGQIRRLDPECLAYALMGMCDFLGMRWVLWGNEDDDLEVVIDSAVELIQRGMAPDGDKRAARPSSPRVKPSKKGVA